MCVRVTHISAYISLCSCVGCTEGKSSH
uniref:Uncharacterized protein n=1 Tax=Anguilla anguilla TaxID=7936 RepID=A0A0E9W3K3_ANGAN